jgi:hypothetical protein
MSSWLGRVHFGSKRKTTIFPLRVTCPCFLCAANIQACSVDFVVSFRLEVIEMLVVLIKRCNAGSSRFIGT